MWTWVMAMVAFALVGSVTPGPVNILAIQHGSTSSRGVACAYVGGASLSYAGVVWLMGQGGAHLLKSPAAVQVAQWLGAAYLLYLAWRIATAPVGVMGQAGERTRRGVLHAAVEGALTQSLNPKAWMVALGGVGLYVLPQADVQTALRVFSIVSLMACTVGVGLWVVAGGLLAPQLAQPRRQKVFNGAMGLLLSLSVAHMLV